MENEMPIQVHRLEVHLSGHDWVCDDTCLRKKAKKEAKEHPGRKINEFFERNKKEIENFHLRTDFDMNKTVLFISPHVAQ